VKTIGEIDTICIPVIKDGETVQVLVVDRELTVAGLLRLVEQIAPGSRIRAVKEGG
jgi:hypothetical protein